MSTFQTSNFAGYVQKFTAAAQAAANAIGAILDFSEGAVLLALGEATGVIALWLQYQILQLIALTRAATSTGSDLDSFFADFGFYRNQATISNGQLVFARASATIQAVVPIGYQDTSSDGTVTTIVTLDTTNANYSSALNGYVLPVNTASITVPAQSVTAGTIANVQAGTITGFSTPLVGVDTVNNPSAFTGAQNKETDPAFRARFPLWLASLRSANIAAIQYAISSTSGVARYTLIRNLSYPGLAAQAGWFFAIVDDGTGSPPDSLIATVAANILTVVGCGIMFGVFAPSRVTINVSMSVVVASGYVQASVQAIVQAAISVYIASLPLQTASVDVSRLAQVAYDATPGVSNVPFAQVLINGANTDLDLTQIEAAAPGTITISTT